MRNALKSTVNVAFLTVGIALCADTSFAQGTVPLAEEPHINEQLMSAAVGDVIRNTCPTISARMVTVYFKVKELEKYARNAGYDEAEVKAFLKDKTQKARIKGLAVDYMTANGVVEGDIESYCALGKAEIRKDSLIGSLLKSK